MSGRAFDDVRGKLWFSVLLLASGLPAFGADATASPNADSGRLALNAETALKMSQAAIGATIGDYTLLSIDGKPVKLSSFRGKPLVINFIYTGCFQVCPTTTRTLKRAVEAEEVATAALELIRNEAVTGQTLAQDAGFLLL